MLKFFKEFFNKLFKAENHYTKIKKSEEKKGMRQKCPITGQEEDDAGIIDNPKKPTNRNYTCPCGFQYHRDGAINRRQKYLGDFGVPVVAEMGSTRMTPPFGFRLEVPS